MKLRIGTRKSKLAMIQTEMVADKILAHFPDVKIEVAALSTQGDRMPERPLSSFGGRGVFARDLEQALLDGRIDLAVHSAKDMPMDLPEGLVLGAAWGRGNPADVLVTLTGVPAAGLKPGSVIGTGSLRRELQIKRINPQVQIRPLRGNVTTRLEKLKEGEYDGILLAAAGLERLKLTKAEGLYVEYLDLETFIPASGQGILAVEIREGEFADIMEAIHEPEAAMALYAEREYLRMLGGGCNAPCAAYCRRERDRLVMNVMYAADGRHPIFRKGDIPAERPDLRQICGKTAAPDNALCLAQKLARQVRMKPVSLVGAGPGDAGLLTVRGLACVRRADAVIYDNLISGSILNEARLDAELVYVGKRSGAHHVTQEEINEMMAERAEKGRYVVRLKGGDPFIFGRGGEEALFLREHEIPYEIVPGVSSAYSVPAYAGIPVTDRRFASSVHVVTGHEGSSKNGENIDYHVLAKEEGTLVFLMGTSRLKAITDQLIQYGKPGDTPAAVIERGTTAGQRKITAELGEIAEKAKTMRIRTPAVLVVGAVAALGDVLDWYGHGPLAGRRVLVTGTRYISEELEEALRPLGAETVAVSLIESRLTDNIEVRRTIESLDQYHWLVFTSGNGVELFFRLLQRERIDLRRLMHLKFAVIGRKTAAVLERHGFQCDFVPETFSGACLAKEWVPTLSPRERVLMLRAREASSVLPEGLKAAGIAYDDVRIYETWTDVRRREELNRLIAEADYVTIASGSAARALSRLLDDRTNLQVRVISIGPFTTQAAEKAGLKVYATAAEYTAEGIAAVILADTAADRGKSGNDGKG